MGKKNYDVVVVGAELNGLGAAITVQYAGLSVVFFSDCRLLHFIHPKLSTHPVCTFILFVTAAKN